MDWVYVLRFLHILGAVVLLGTGAGIAFFMMMAVRTAEPKIIAHTAGVVVIADWVFTASAVVAQPITGALLAVAMGWQLSEPWILASLGLYILVGFFWIPVVWMQRRLRDLAREAYRNGAELPQEFHRLYGIWFAFGFPAFFAVLAIIWLMIVRPSF